MKYSHPFGQPLFVTASGVIEPSTNLHHATWRGIPAPGHCQASQRKCSYCSQVTECPRILVLLSNSLYINRRDFLDTQCISNSYLAGYPLTGFRGLYKHIPLSAWRSMEYFFPCHIVLRSDVDPD